MDQGLLQFCILETRVKHFLYLKYELSRLLGCEVDLVNSRNVLPIFKESIDKEGIAL